MGQAERARMKILITGGSGFIGAPLVKKLLGSGHELLIYDVLPDFKALGQAAKEVKMVRGDVSNWAELYDACKSFEPDGIIHLAALISQHAEQRPLEALKINVNGTVTAFEIARKLGVKRIVFPSTVATFNSEVPSPVSDDERQRPNTVYGITKVFCELWGNYYHERYGIDFRSVRLPSVIGPGRTNGGASVYASLMIEMPARGLAYEIHAAPESSIPLLYIQDAVHAVVALLEAKHSPRTVYNASGIAPKASEIASEVKKQIPQADIKFKPDSGVVQMLKQWQQMDSASFEKDIGWSISFPLEKLVADFIGVIRKMNSSANQENAILLEEARAEPH